MAQNTIALIAKRAKAIRKNSPNMAWQTALKKASAEIKKDSVKTTRKKPVAKKTLTRKTVAKKRVSTVKKMAGVSSKVKKYSIGKVDSNKLLTSIAKENSLNSFVVRSIKSHAKDYGTNGVETFISEVLHFGCESGLVSELVYYEDTVKFYKKHKTTIQKMLRAQMIEFGANSPAELFGRKWDNDDPFAEETTNQNLLAWYAYEEVCREIADRLGIEI